MESNIAFICATAGASCDLSTESAVSSDEPGCAGFLGSFIPGLGGDLDGFGFLSFESSCSVTLPEDFTFGKSGFLDGSSFDLLPNLGTGFLFLANGKVTSSELEELFTCPNFFSVGPLFFTCSS
jgi:hypothetical protein